MYPHRSYKILAGKNIIKQQAHNSRAHQNCILAQVIPWLSSSDSNNTSWLNSLATNILFGLQVKTLLIPE